ncbi:MAG: transporter family protein [Clostridia bacterium]|jgi:iron complex transport system ATP-binding protein|nr:transporter family protein [Clostridia bacterium]
MLKVEKLSTKIDNKVILDNISFELEKNDMLTIIGPNGSGKTTIVKSIMGDIKYTGNIYLNEKNIKKIYISDISKYVGVLMQNHNLEFDNTVYDIVSLGRYTYIKDMFGNLNDIDRKKIDDAMKLADIENLKSSSINNISGGELQRVFLALVLAQDPDILILDEPTNHLDLKHQIDIFDILKKWSLQEGKSIIAIIHDLNLAHKYATKALLIKEGKSISCGDVKSSLTRETLKETYDIDIFEWMQALLQNWK